MPLATSAREEGASTSTRLQATEYSSSDSESHLKRRKESSSCARLLCGRGGGKDSSSDSSSDSDSFVWPILNRCLECGTEMGDGNQRQLCGKWRCDGAYTNMSSYKPLAASAKQEEALTSTRPQTTEPCLSKKRSRCGKKSSCARLLCGRGGGKDSSSESSSDSDSDSFVWPILNRCLECGTDMGDGNPRQLCGKWRCDNTHVVEISE